MTFQVIEHRCKGGSRVRSSDSEQAATLHFLEQVEFALRTWKDEDIKTHVTAVALMEVNGHVDEIGTFGLRCHHMTQARVGRA